MLGDPTDATHSTKIRALIRTTRVRCQGLGKSSKTDDRFRSEMGHSEEEGGERKRKKRKMKK